MYAVLVFRGIKVAKSVKVRIKKINHHIKSTVMIMTIIINYKNRVIKCFKKMSTKHIHVRMQLVLAYNTFNMYWVFRCNSQSYLKASSYSQSVPLGLLAKIAKRDVVTLSMEKTVNQHAIVPKMDVTILVDVLQTLKLLYTKN